MLELDDGALCAEATALINEHATEELFASDYLNQFAAGYKKSVENLQPPKAGNSLQLLEQFTGNCYQSEGYVRSRCGGNYEDPEFNWTLLNIEPRNRSDLLSLSKNNLTAEEFLTAGEELDREVWFSRNDDLRVCRFQSNVSCSQSTRVVHFTYEGEWALQDQLTVKCVR